MGKESKDPRKRRNNSDRKDKDKKRKRHSSPPKKDSDDAATPKSKKSDLEALLKSLSPQQIQELVKEGKKIKAKAESESETEISTEEEDDYGTDDDEATKKNGGDGKKKKRKAAPRKSPRKKSTPHYDDDTSGSEYSGEEDCEASDDEASYDSEKIKKKDGKAIIKDVPHPFELLEGIDPEFIKLLAELIKLEFRKRKIVYTPLLEQQHAENMLDRVAQIYPLYLIVDPKATPEIQEWQKQNRLDWVQKYSPKCLSLLNTHKTTIVIPGLRNLCWAVLAGNFNGKGYDGQPITDLPTVEQFEQVLNRTIDYKDPKNLNVIWFYFRYALPTVAGKKMLKPEMLASHPISTMPLTKEIDDYVPNVPHAAPKVAAGTEKMISLAKEPQLLVPPSTEAIMVTIFKNYRERWVPQHQWKLANLGSPLPMYTTGEDGRKTDKFPTHWGQSLNDGSVPAKFCAKYGSIPPNGVNYFIQAVKDNRAARHEDESKAIEKLVVDKAVEQVGAVAADEGDNEAETVDQPTFPDLDDEY